MMMLVDLTISVWKKFSKSLIWFSLMELASTAAFASPTVEAKHCGNALKRSLNGDITVTIPASQCPLSASLSEWATIQKKAGFSKIKSFLSTHPSWPSQETIRKKAEEDLFTNPQATKVILDWFEKYPPLTAKGMLLYAQALHKLTPNLLQKKLAPLLLSLSFSESELRSLLEKYHSYLKPKTLFTKAHLLLDKQENTSLVKLFIPYLTEEQQQIINLRLNPLKKPSLSAVTHPGILLDNIRLRRIADRTDEAIALLKLIPEIPEIQADSFWTEQNILARRLIEQKRYQDAYDVVKKHRLVLGETFANAEWMSGWLSLQFLKKTDQALIHFKKLREKVKSPISIARASYWLGRTYKILANNEDANKSFKEAATHIGTYYGQLSQKELIGKIHPIALKRSFTTAKMKQKFNNRELIQIIRLLLEIGETSHAETFAIAAAKLLKSPKEHELLVELMHEKGGHYLGVQTAKKVTTGAAPLIPAAYPRLPTLHKGTVDPALAHAIIRQESRFKPDAISPAGAIGLMQLMPATAANTMKKHKIKTGSLTHAHINVSVGTRHLKDLLEDFNGSMILAAAAYNAGKNAVENWLMIFGDPRNPSIDSVDWVELIPYAETRNYVQRVMENYYCYRHK